MDDVIIHRINSSERPRHTCSWAISPSLSLSWDCRLSMTLDPPPSRAASYRLVPLMDMVMVLKELSRESSCWKKQPQKPGEVMTECEISRRRKVSLHLNKCGQGWDEYTCEKREEGKPACSAPLTELERDSVGVEDAGASVTDRLRDFLSWWNKNRD